MKRHCSSRSCKSLVRENVVKRQRASIFPQVIEKEEKINLESVSHFSYAICYNGFIELRN
jgi:hypothetical protein